MNYLFRNNFCRQFYTSAARREEALDPIQALFLKYVREYFKRLKENNGNLFELSPELELERCEKIHSLLHRYFGDIDLDLVEKFPEINFEEPQLDDINLPKGSSSALSHPLLKKS
ncbi:ATP synthase-coupling factor 6, mitochondrial-like isoform X1 [Halyomorpha halys]|uniref:ATP synthase-coupling factor 6, mitochondrial-like isoform X1 n=1 Tax=Halyomorpha halys TaxID=286706 RepID=UPI0034D1E684